MTKLIAKWYTFMKKVFLPSYAIVDVDNVFTYNLSVHVLSNFKLNSH